MDVIWRVVEQRHTHKSAMRNNQREHKRNTCWLLYYQLRTNITHKALGNLNTYSMSNLTLHHIPPTKINKHFTTSWKQLICETLHWFDDTTGTGDVLLLTHWFWRWDCRELGRRGYCRLRRRFHRSAFIEVWRRNFGIDWNFIGESSGEMKRVSSKFPPGCIHKEGARGISFSNHWSP